MARTKSAKMKTPMEQIDSAFFIGMDYGRFPAGFSLSDYYELCRVRYELNTDGRSESINGCVSGYCARIGFNVSAKGVGFLISQ